MTTLSMDYPINFAHWNRISEPVPYEVMINPLTRLTFPSSASISTRIDDLLSFLSRNYFVINNRLSIDSFLTENNDLIAYLYQAPENIFQYFNISQVEIGLFTDPDSFDMPEMYIEIYTELTPEDANYKLSLLNKDWILRDSNSKIGDLNLTLKFI